jgi:hypothetical protein
MANGKEKHTRLDAVLVPHKVIEQREATRAKPHLRGNRRIDRRARIFLVVLGFVFRVVSEPTIHAAICRAAVRYIDKIAGTTEVGNKAYRG